MCLCIRLRCVFVCAYVCACLCARVRANVAVCLSAGFYVTAFVCFVRARACCKMPNMFYCAASCGIFTSGGTSTLGPNSQLAARACTHKTHKYRDIEASREKL
mmetsp:Transcript_32498/g.52346  ORF Transcript_32498/g.52346 Transcript_32498/m.52346 type:complete len:103 (-) Transcript_32498:192-500(-)